MNDSPEQINPVVWGETTNPGLLPTRNFTGDTSRIASDIITYNSYSGTDISAVILLPNEPAPLILGELQTISYSIHRENKPVRILGNTNPIGFVKGPRTIAGSLIFTVFDRYVFYRLQQYKHAVSAGFHPLSDMLPLFDIVLSFSNETGSFSKMRIYGVTIIDEGQTMSVDDLITEQTYTFMAKGIQPLVQYTPQGMPPYESEHLPQRGRNRSSFIE